MSQIQLPLLLLFYSDVSQTVLLFGRSLGHINLSSHAYGAAPWQGNVEENCAVSQHLKMIFFLSLLNGTPCFHPTFGIRWLLKARRRKKGLREEEEGNNNCCILGIGGELNETLPHTPWHPGGANAEERAWGKEGQRRKSKCECCARRTVRHRVLINSAPCLLGSNSSGDTMNNSPRPPALAVTRRGSHN